jgi:hypothetical protein
MSQQLSHVVKNLFRHRKVCYGGLTTSALLA